MTSLFVEPVPERVLLVLDGPAWRVRQKLKHRIFEPDHGTVWNHPSLNSWANQRNFVVDRIKAAWVEKICQTARGLDRIHGPVRVTVTTYFPTLRRRDADNFVPKFILDGLKECLIDDDNSGVVVDLVTRLRIDPAAPRTAILIEPVVEPEQVTAADIARIYDMPLDDLRRKMNPPGPVPGRSSPVVRHGVAASAHDRRDQEADGFESAAQSQMRHDAPSRGRVGAPSGAPTPPMVTRKDSSGGAVVEWTTSGFRSQAREPRAKGRK